MEATVARRIVDRTPALLFAGAAFSATIFIALNSLYAAVTVAIVTIGVLYIFRKEPMAMILYAIVFTAFAALTASLKPNTSVIAGEELQGTVEEIRETPLSQRAYINTTDAGRVAVIVTDIVPKLSEGDIVRFHGTSTSPHRRSSAPFFTSERLNTAASRITANVIVASQDIVVIGHDNSLNYKLLQRRRDLGDIIHASPLDTEASDILATAIFATDDVNPDLRNNFRITGLSHLLCVSGFHVGIVATLVFIFLSPMRITGRRMTLRYALAVVLIWLYALVVGMSASVTRAAVMLSLFALAKITQRSVNPLNTLLVAFCTVLALNPWQLFSAGFQLSFAAVAGIILLARKLNPFAERNRLWFKTAAIFTIPVAALLATAPIMLLWFQRLPLLSVPVNAVGTLIFPLFMIVSGIGVALWHAGLPSAAIIYIANKLFELLKGIVESTSEFSGRFSLIMAPSVAQFIIIVMLLALLIYALHVRRHIKAVLATGLCLMVVLAGCRFQTPESSIYIDGDMRGTDAVVATHGKVELSTSGGRAYPIINTNPILAAYSCDSLTLKSGADMIKAGKHTIVYLTDASQCPEEAIIIVTRRSAKEAPESIIARRPHHVILGADISRDCELRFIHALRRCSVPYTDLRDNAFFIHMGSAQK